MRLNKDPIYARDKREMNCEFIIYNTDIIILPIKLLIKQIWFRIDEIFYLLLRIIWGLSINDV